MTNESRKHLCFASLKKIFQRDNNLDQTSTENEEKEAEKWITLNEYNARYTTSTTTTTIQSLIPLREVN